MEDLTSRTRRFALDVVRYYSQLPKNTEFQVLGKQFIRSGTSVGAHYREACRARSVSEFTAKIEGGLQELEETRYWLELMDALLEERDGTRSIPTAKLLQEATELSAILTACAKNAKARKRLKDEG